MSAAGFAVPFALSARGALVGPDDARKATVYRCPDCAGPVDLHAGEHKRRHFHHRASTGCTSESVRHRTAKRLVVQAVVAWRDGGEPPVFLRSCAAKGCGRSSRQAMPSKIREAVEELRLPTGRVVDVGLVGHGGLPVAAVEVHQSHAVDHRKSRDLPLPWIEVEAAQVCETAGTLLVPTRDRFLPWLCEEHSPTRRERARAGREEPLRRNAILRQLPFRLKDYPGYRIERVVVCARGHDALLFAWEGKVPPWPRPPLVVAREAEGDWKHGSDGQLRRHLPFRRSYVSACPRCGAPLDDDGSASAPME